MLSIDTLTPDQMWATLILLQSANYASMDNGVDEDNEVDDDADIDLSS